MYLYVIVSLLIIYVVFFIIFRMKHSFWAIQPVFHYHNLRYWLFPPGIITHKQFPITKYYKPFRIKVKNFETLTSLDIDNMHQLVSQHYLQDKDISYSPTRENIKSYFKDHDTKCYYASYTNLDCVKDLKKGTIHKKEYPISVLTSRPLFVSLYTNKLTSHYVDYLCVHSKFRGKNIAPETIYTYAVEMSKQEKKNITFLFKREGESTAIVPLVVYRCYWYDTTHWIPKTKFPLPYTLTQINNDNKELLLREYNTYKNKFDCNISSSISNIVELIKSHAIIPYIIHNKDEVVAIYFFRNGFVSYNGHGVIDLIGSILVDDSFIEFFQLGTNEAYLHLQKQMKDTNINYLNIENISHNYHLINSINTTYKPIHTIPYSYYFYNFATRPLLPEKCFILC